jgi:iron complex outermembrane receptor protein
VSFTTTFESTSGRAGLVFNPTPNTALYGQFATAADPVSALVTTNLAQKDFDVSTGRQWEAGVKNSFWRGRGEWTFAAYDIVKKKLLTRDALDPGITVQIGQQSSRGAEASLAVAVGGGLHLTGNMSFVDPRFDDFAESVGGVRISRNGNVPQDAARRSANFIALWHIGEDWTANTAVRYVGSRFQDAANTRIIPAYTVVDTTVQRDILRNAVVGLTIRNLTDELYARNIYGSTTQWIVGDPRSVELSLRLRF